MAVQYLNDDRPDIITARKLTLGYEREVDIISEADFSIKVNDFVIITGPSGSGKSTLLKSFYGGLDIKGGYLNVCLCDLKDIGTSGLRNLRKRIVIIFQDYRLINEWNVEKNIMLPLMIMGQSPQICKKQA